MASFWVKPPPQGMAAALRMGLSDAANPPQGKTGGDGGAVGNPLEKGVKLSSKGWLQPCVWA